MSSLKDKIERDFTAALKQRAAVNLSTLRLLKSAIEKRAKERPGELTDEDILHGTLATNHYADPNAIMLPDGRAWLVIMNQAAGPRPPVGRLGTLHAYVSSDGGETFDYDGELLGWSDFTDLDVRSLNDPKVVLLPDGRLRVYVAAMIPDSTKEDGYGWAIVSVTQR